MSKQGNLATVFALARQYPRLHFRAVEPGVNPGSNLAREMSAPLRALGKAVSPIAPLIPHYSTPKRAARIITKVLTDTSDATGVYYDENGKPMLASKQARDPEFSDRYVAETRELLATVPSERSSGSDHGETTCPRHRGVLGNREGVCRTPGRRRLRPHRGGASQLSLVG